jgi:hypothetical protein
MGLTPEIIARIKKNSPDIPAPGYYDLLVSMAGYSPQTTAQAFLVLRPKKLYILSSHDTQGKIDDIWSEIQNVIPGEVRMADVAQGTCQPTDPLDIYKQIKNEIYRLIQHRPKIVIDITGGKKVMSAAAALAAWQLDMDIIYSENDSYHVTKRGPEDIGNTRIIKLDNPITIFCEQEEARIDALFNQGQFNVAASEYAALPPRMSQHAAEKSWSIAFKAQVAKLYAAWCDMNKGMIRDILKSLKLKEVTFLKPDQKQKLKNQTDFLSPFAQAPDASPVYLLTTFYLLGNHYSNIGRFDFASLLFYRCLEGALDSRLERVYPGFKCDCPDYSLITYDVKSLEADYGKINLKVFSDSERPLPRQLAFIQKATLLAALNDKFISEAGSNSDPLKNLNDWCSLSQARNNSILAHGQNNITPKACDDLKKAAKIMLDAYLRYYPDDLPGLPDLSSLAFLKW